MDSATASDLPNAAMRAPDGSGPATARWAARLGTGQWDTAARRSSASALHQGLKLPPAQASHQLVKK